MLYLIHFQNPYQHAKHYLGYVSTKSGRDPVDALVSRMMYHRSGQGSRLLRAVTRAGIRWSVVRIWEDGTQAHERRLKAHSSTRLCPVCSGEPALRRGLPVTPPAYAAKTEPTTAA